LSSTSRSAVFRALHPGDLTRNKEFELMCPRPRIAPIDVFLGMHHGQDTSNSEVLVHALHPRVAIMNNGTRKGGVPEVMKVTTRHRVSKICGRYTSPC
jgi:beta-lactamase superfamily II metal-dependent hydrolase